MEERLEKALEFANYRQTLNNQIQKLKIRSEGMLTIAKNGGNFTINRDFINFLDYTVRNQIKAVVLLDNNSLPILIDDTESFLKEVTQRYTEVTNDYYKEYQLLRKARNVKSILDLKD